MNRRTFMASAAATVLPLRRDDSAFAAHAPEVMTVSGPMPADSLGKMLPHEHIMVDFIGADQVSPARYRSEDVVAVTLPHLLRLHELGGRTLVECTPAYLGRDPALLRRVAELSGVHILTNTGYYGAANDKFLPPHAHTESAESLAERWLSEWRHGIGDTGIRPGFIKIGVDGAPLSDVDRKLVRAAALTHRESGLVIAAHTTDGDAALEELDILERDGVDASAFIWVHANAVDRPDVHREAATRGAWVEFDGVSPEHVEQHVALVRFMADARLLDRVLLSHDAGWYHVGEEDGGEFREYTTLFEDGVSALRVAGFSDEEIDMLLARNPARAFTVLTRLL